MDIYAVNATVNILFTTNAAAGGAVAPSGAFGTDDIVIYKDGSATQRSSTSGWTVTSPFDSVTGLHLLAIDLSDNTDAGFYAAGSIYTVILAPNETVDSQTVVAVIGRFKIGTVDANVTTVAGTTQTARDLGLALPAAAPNAAGGLLITAAGSLDMDDIGADVDAIETRVVLALPSAAPQAAGGLITSTAGSLDLDEMNVDVEAIQAQTDKLAFTVANKVDANVTDVDGAALGSHHAGYLPTDLYYWRNAQPGAISSVGGYIPSMLMRWLTDDSAGTPSALSSGLVQALAALTSGERTTLIAALLNTVNTGASFNVNNSVGKQIRVSAGNVPLTLRTGTCQSGSTANTIKLDSGAPSVNGLFVNCIVQLTGGTGANQTATIIAYNGTTKVATIASKWAVTPDGTTTFAITGSSSSLVSLEGTAQAGGASTITLPAAAVAIDSYYNDALVTILSGTGSGQTRVITGYVGSTQVATVDSAWSVQPDNTSVVAVIPFPGNVQDQIQVPTVAQIVSGLLAQALVSRDLSAVTAPTVQDALAAAVAVGAGAEQFTGTTLTLKFLDGSTLRAFTVDSATAPTSRT